MDEPIELKDEEIEKDGTTQYSIRLSKAENDAIAKAQDREPFKSLEVSKRKIIKLAILDFARDRDDKVLERLTRDIALMESNTIRAIQVAIGTALSAGLKVVSKPAGGGGEVVKPPRANAKATPEEKEDAAVRICDLLGGTVAGKSCSYMKYEVMPTGRAVSFPVTMPLSSLTQADVDGQYDPSKEEWEAAKAQEV